MPQQSSLCVGSEGRTASMLLGGVPWLSIGSIAVLVHFDRHGSLFDISAAMFGAL